MRNIPGTELNVFPICLGGNVFGGHSTEDQSFAVLDAYVGAGGNFIDTADLYAGTESEMVIGRWMAARGNRDDLVIATKVGMMDGLDNLKAETIAKGCEDSLTRLGTDRIDLFYTHKDDIDTPLEETAKALGDLVEIGKVRAIGASNFSAERLVTALDISRAEGLPDYVALQPHYNLMEREFETDGQQALAERENLAVFPYFSLAMGFLTGKHRPEGSDESSKRTEGARKYLESERGPRVLDVLDAIANEYGTTPTAVALAWLLAQPTVMAPIASARIPEQVPDLIAGSELELGEGDLAKLEAASA